MPIRFAVRTVRLKLYILFSQSDDLALHAMPIRFAVRTVRLKLYILCSQSDDLALHSMSQLRLKLDKCLTCATTAISQTVFKLWHSNLTRHLSLKALSPIGTLISSFAP